MNKTLVKKTLVKKILLGNTCENCAHNIFNIVHLNNLQYGCIPPYSGKPEITLKIRRGMVLQCDYAKHGNESICKRWKLYDK